MLFSTTAKASSSQGKKLQEFYLHVRNWFSDLIFNFKQLFEPLRTLENQLVI